MKYLPDRKLMWDRVLFMHYIYILVFFAFYELYTGRFISFQPIWEITICVLIGFVSRGEWDLRRI
jgi:hypothetical protein